MYELAARQRQIALQIAIRSVQIIQDSSAESYTTRAPLLGRNESECRAPGEKLTFWGLRPPYLELATRLLWADVANR